MVMIESTAYFESYIHVLKKIKIMDLWENIPFGNIIALGDREELPQPQYLLNDFNRYQTHRTIMEGVNESNLDDSQRNALMRCLFSSLAIV
jgi:hypothetical protein